jgi:hypothetical protein
VLGFGRLRGLALELRRRRCRWWARGWRGWPEEGEKGRRRTHTVGGDGIVFGFQRSGSEGLLGTWAPGTQLGGTDPV